MPALLGLLKLVPTQVWVGLGLFAAAVTWLVIHDHRIRDEQRTADVAEFDGKMKAAQAVFAAELDKKRSEVSDLVLRGLAERDANAKALQDEAVKRDAVFAQLKAQRSTNVTPAAVAACGDLHRGVIVQFNLGAAHANGAADGAPAANAPAESPDAASGVTLDRYSAAAEDTQNALGTCRAEVSGWQKHWSTVTAWYDSLRQLLNSCFPQGAP